MNPWDTINYALAEARDLNRAINEHTDRMARLLRGRLRHVDADVLVTLKRELRNFNIHTGKWKP